MKLNIRQCETVSFSNGTGPLTFVLVPVRLLLKAKNVRRKHPQQAVFGNELSQAVSGEHRLASKSEAVAFSEHCAQQLDERLVVFPVAGAGDLVVRLPFSRYEKLARCVHMESQCKDVPFDYLFTSASWVAFIKK
ncbi:MAG: hypothetical protein UY50_C0001G0016 [Parcubacteria group bacterium GW2011_GWA2_49_9]|nr:MAG: hypothetical protein UY50_C0001G0016 [Parcubacteria group bacterium GW2011_GWA2_49_9]